MSQICDFLIVGGGIAGATAAHALSEHGEVIVLERESALAYHTTGRSAAQFFDTYGGAEIIKLNMASRPFFDAPPEDFSEVPLLHERGAMFFASEGQLDHMAQHLEESLAAGANIFPVDTAEAVRKVPILRPDRIAGALSEPDSKHMDVHAIHQGFLRGARRRAAKTIVDAEVTAVQKQGGAWRVTSRAGDFSAPWVINAAGAWCDELAGLAGIVPVGLVPKRRTAILIDAPSGHDISRWPMVISMREDVYFKPDSGRLLASPADETPMPPCDIQPDDLDIAVLVDRLQQVTTLEVRRIEHRWAGLRSFVPDHNLVIGEEPEHPGFFWLAGQGGYGIQTSPAAGRACAGLIVSGRLPDDLLDWNISAPALSPIRCRT